MDDMNLGELLVEKTEENQTRKILEILEGCKRPRGRTKEKIKAPAQQVSRALR